MFLFQMDYDGLHSCILVKTLPSIVKPPQVYTLAKYFHETFLYVPPHHGYLQIVRYDKWPHLREPMAIRSDR